MKMLLILMMCTFALGAVDAVRLQDQEEGGGTRPGAPPPSATTDPFPQDTVCACAVAPAWVNASRGRCPRGAFLAGHERNGSESLRVYVARARHEGDLLPGKLVPAFGSAYVSWAGKEYPMARYQVLVGDSFRWVHTNSQADIPPNAVKAGETRKGETLFVCRAPCGGGDGIGKAHRARLPRDPGVCYVPFHGEEHSFYDNYEILVKTYRPDQEDEPVTWTD